jgi:hypothetical protein
VEGKNGLVDAEFAWFCSKGGEWKRKFKSDRQKNNFSDYLIGGL